MRQTIAIIAALTIMAALAVLTGQPPAMAEQHVGGIDTGDMQFVASSTVGTSGTILDITGSAYVKTYSVTIINDDSSITIYVEMGQSSAAGVTSADFPLLAGETLTLTRADGAWRYAGIKAASGTPAYRVLAFY